MRTPIPSLALAFALALGGCAHQISIVPDVGRLDAPAARLKPGAVGLYVAPEDRARQVITPGGGGDKVSYYPYRDLESGLYRVLGNLFERVVSVASANDLEGLAKAGVSMVARPQVTTQSSSPSPLTWPPTVFQVQIACVFTDITGTTIAEVLVTGSGKAEFDEFKSDFALAAKRATEDALRKMQGAIASETRLR